MKQTDVCNEYISYQYIPRNVLPSIYILFCSRESEDVFALTDSSLEKLLPWPVEIPLQVFGSRIRFSIRLNDLRKEALDPNIDVTVDQVMAFFNPVIGELLNRYTKEIEDTSERKKTWKYAMHFCHLF